MNSAPQTAWLTRLRSRCIRVLSGTRVRVRGRGHRVDIDEARLFGAKIEISGENNELSVGPNSRLWGAVIKLHGQNLRCVIGEHCRLRNVEITLEDANSRLVIKSSTSGTGCRLLSGEGGLVEVGEDCMMSVNADVRNTDGHSVIDLATGDRINPARDVILADHVWLGLRVQVLKGVTIGEHSIVAAGSVVVKDVAPYTVVAGIPAKTVREGVTWQRERIAANDRATIATK
jgi:acetyltransferase-like isoleucine patch superfamily enzyme